VTPGRQFLGAGGRSNEGRIEVDGLSVGPPRGSGSGSYNADVGNAQEVTTTSTGGLGESAVGGPTVSIVPRSGGNTFQGTAFVASVRSWMVGNNLTQDLIDRGLGQPGDVETLWDNNLGFGTDRQESSVVFTNLRDQGPTEDSRHVRQQERQRSNKRTRGGLEPSGEGAGSWTVTSLRLTQPTPKSRVGVSG
jgi:hypothetical protein